MSSKVREAVEGFALREGHDWKDKLVDRWRRSDFSGYTDDQAELLRKARVKFGPEGLGRIRVLKGGLDGKR